MNSHPRDVNIDALISFQKKLDDAVFDAFLKKYVSIDQDSFYKIFHVDILKKYSLAKKIKEWGDANTSVETINNNLAKLIDRLREYLILNIDNADDKATLALARGFRVNLYIAQYKYYQAKDQTLAIKALNNLKAELPRVKDLFAKYGTFKYVFFNNSLYAECDELIDNVSGYIARNTAIFPEAVINLEKVSPANTASTKFTVDYDITGETARVANNVSEIPKKRKSKKTSLTDPTTVTLTTEIQSPATTELTTQEITSPPVDLTTPEKAKTSTIKNYSEFSPELIAFLNGQLRFEFKPQQADFLPTQIIAEEIVAKVVNNPIAVEIKMIEVSKPTLIDRIKADFFDLVHEFMEAIRSIITVVSDKINQLAKEEPDIHTQIEENTPDYSSMAQSMEVMAENGGSLKFDIKDPATMLNESRNLVKLVTSFSKKYALGAPTAPEEMRNSPSI